MAKARTIVDERTLAGWFSSPTEARATRLLAENKEPVFFHADVEEHVQDPETGVTKRCDVTLRSRTHPIATVEMKRPEVAAADSPSLQNDSWSKAVGRGLPYFLTANFREILVWETSKGPDQTRPLLRFTLAADLSHSSFAPKRRAEISDNWVKFLDEFSQILQEREGKKKGPRKLPPQVLELKEVIHEAAEEAAERIRAAADDEAFRQGTLEAFRLQFGVEISLNPHGSKDRLLAESLQVATIATFVVATRLMLYQALANSTRSDGTSFDLDVLDITRSTGDPQRVLSDLAGLYEHARRKTGDFETQFSPSELDDIVFVDAASSRRDVGERWGKIIDVVQGADWEAPVTYVPGLYESLLDDEHRHVMGVHYTPDPVVELITAYAVQDPADIVLDPASGAGTFVTMCYERKRALGSTHDQSLAEVYAVELAQFAASLTGFNLTLADTTASSAYPRVFRTDFFQTYPGERSGLELPDVGRLAYPQQVDAVVGNPPYIRFENRLPEEREEVFKFLQKHFLKTQTAYPNFTGKADIWAFFVAGAHMYLRPGGRLGFIVSWNLLASDYGDAVITFLARYFKIHALIDSRVERWFAAKQNTVIILAEKVADPPAKLSHQSNPNVPGDHQVRFVRLKRPIDELVSSDLPRGKRAEDLVDEILAADHDAGDDLRWDIRIFEQKALLEVETSRDGFGDD
ncbi:Eco57I restriction-modification methylase domain-containing protein [Streptomyces sp. NPDC059720]|uniref:Eco57I restriction-modification methylase domain-containing protein n=1 Tax=Streptomyces sp. NPDC059720 TaxID=3346924 RepID=UPI0036C94716